MHDRQHAAGRGAARAVAPEEHPQILRWLAFLELFEDVPEDELAILLAGAEWVVFERGDVVMDGTDAVPSAYILRTGSFSTALSWAQTGQRSEEHTSELQSRENL